MRTLSRCAFVSLTSLLSSICVVAPTNSYAISELDEPEMILKGVQGKLNKAKTFMTTSMEEKGDVKIETVSVVKQHGQGVISCRQEQRATVPGVTPQPFVSVIDCNKIYFFPTGCGNVVVRMKYLESREPNSPVANLFFPDGVCEKVKETPSDWLIRYTCTPKEVQTLKTALEKKLGVPLKRDMTPAVLDYKIAKEPQTLLEATFYSERGKLIAKQTFKDWQFDMEIPDSKFAIPKDFRLYVVKSAKEAERLQSELMKKTMEEQTRKRQQEKKSQKR